MQDRHDKQPKFIARKLHLTGVVQGVGFRPFVFRLAEKYQLKGWVLNSASGLEIWIEGEPAQVRAFEQELSQSPPPLARVLQQNSRIEAVQAYPDFRIRHSQGKEDKVVLISPDVATCLDCYREVLDPDDRRYQYPFTNCTNCGPRYTIIQDVPYDRQNTTMQKFAMCPLCLAEYQDPYHRRFHAQPNACPACGPQVELWDAQGVPVEAAADPIEPGAFQAAVFSRLRTILQQGFIVAIKGLGGFHLACDALNPSAVQQLRRRKQREGKPFAVMGQNIEVIKKYCSVSAAEADLLQDLAAPIVLLNLIPLGQNQSGNKEYSPGPALPLEDLAPGLNTLGTMLPYTPLHHLLFSPDLPLLVMTSANRSDDPLVTQNAEAVTRLAGIADFFLVHNRDIHRRCDDSLVRMVGQRKQFFRRARGYVPFPLPLAEKGPAVLGVGGELKNAFCFTRQGEAFMSQHLGDLNHWGNYQQFLEAVPSLEKMLEVKPEAIGYDLHPDYATTRFATAQNEVLCVGIQHHHGHLAACLGENQQVGPALGVICDGTGLGTDGSLWGFEFLYGDFGGYQRLASLRPTPLPGGEISIRRPGRMTWTYIYTLLGAQEAKQWAQNRDLGLKPGEEQILEKQIRQGLQTWLTSSCGRLFDAVSAVLGVCLEVDYEGQAAIELETLAAQGRKQEQAVPKLYAFPLLANREDPQNILWERPRILRPKPDPDPAQAEHRASKVKAELVKPAPRYCLDPTELWRGILTDLNQGVDKALIAWRFHQSVIAGIVQTCQKLTQEIGIQQVALSGGVFQNRLLLEGVMEQLIRSNLEVLTNQVVPANDGGLALGQALIARAVLQKEKKNQPAQA